MRYLGEGKLLETWNSFVFQTPYTHSLTHIDILHTYVIYTEPGGRVTAYF